MTPMWSCTGSGLQGAMVGLSLRSWSWRELFVPMAKSGSMVE